MFAANLPRIYAFLPRNLISNTAKSFCPWSCEIPANPYCPINRPCRPNIKYNQVRQWTR